MTCHEARELFSARFDDRLASDDAARLATHLAGCDDCRLEWARFERVVSLVQAVEPSRAPAGFVDRVLEAARPVPWPLRLLRQVFTPMQVKLPLEAAALLLVGGLAVMTFQRSPEMQRVARQDSESPAAPTAPAQGSDTPAAPQATSPQVASPPPSAPAVGSQDASRPASPAESQAPRRDAPLPDRIARSEPTPAPPPAPQSDRARPTAPAAPSAPAPPSIPQTAIARSPAPQPAPAAPPAPAPQPAPAARPSVVQELRRDTIDSGRRESAAKSAAAPPAAAPLAARARPPAPDVSTWLTVADRAAALTALAETVTRFGGRETARRAEGRADIVEVTIPRDVYDAFIREVSRLGGFAAERQTAELPASVRVSLSITD
jgi:hypothetical protein